MPSKILEICISSKRLPVGTPNIFYLPKQDKRRIYESMAETFSNNSTLLAHKTMLIEIHLPT
jgi:hypothetical protein